MAGDWIKIRTELISGLDVIAIGVATGLDEYQVVGRLVKLWGWANHNTSDGHLRKMTPELLDRHVSHQGFASALMDVGWLVQSGEGVTIPNWQKHNGSGAKARAESAARQAASRSRHGRVTKSCDRSVTPVTDSCDKSVTREEKRREEKKREEPKPKTGAAPPLVLPAVLDTPEFRAAWLDYEANRKEAGHAKLTTRGREAKFKDLADWGHDVAVQSIRESIANGWQGIFKPKGNANGRSNQRDSGAGQQATNGTGHRAPRPTAAEERAKREFPEPPIDDMLAGLVYRPTGGGGSPPEALRA